jgi:hypothetical protein
MKALSLLQPWATLIMLGVKLNETRSWSTKHRGPLAIHASAGKPAGARLVAETDPYIKAALEKHGLTFDTLPRGQVLGTCELVEVARIVEEFKKPMDGAPYIDPYQLYTENPSEYAAGDYTPGRYAWLLSEVVVLETPIPCKGSLSLWEVPADVLNQVAKEGGHHA